MPNAAQHILRMQKITGKKHIYCFRVIFSLTLYIGFLVGQSHQIPWPQGILGGILVQTAAEAESDV